ncbi:hypothetical protein V8D89_000442 [Ganoderma adspersum]
MSSVEENCLDPDSPCSLSPSVISSLASSLAATHTVLVTVAPDPNHSIHLTAGAEVGIAIGAVFLVIFLGSLVSMLRRRRRRGRHVSEIDFGDPSSPIMAETGYPHFPRLPGESVTSLVRQTRDTDTPPGQDGAAIAPQDRTLPGTAPQSPPRPAKLVAKRRAASDAQNEDAQNEGGSGGGADGTSSIERDVQAVPYETDGGVRLAGGRLEPPLEERGDERHGGSSEAGTVPPPPYAEY